MMKLSHLLAALPHYSLRPTRAPSLPSPARGTTTIKPIGDLTITKISADSRQIEPGACFVAYPGVNLDLHRFIPEAISRGATAIV